MTTGVKGASYGNAPRKCPSLGFSPRVIMAFLTQFFTTFKVDAIKGCPQDPNNRSWFWNKVDPSQLLVAAKTNEVDLAKVRADFLSAFVTNYKNLANRAVKNQIEQGRHAGFFSCHRQGVNLCVDIEQAITNTLSADTAQALMQRLETLTRTRSYTHNKVSTQALLAIKQREKPHSEQADNRLTFEQRVNQQGVFSYQA